MLQAQTVASPDSCASLALLTLGTAVVSGRRRPELDDQPVVGIKAPLCAVAGCSRQLSPRQCGRRLGVKQSKLLTGWPGVRVVRACFEVGEQSRLKEEIQLRTNEI